MPANSGHCALSGECVESTLLLSEEFADFAILAIISLVNFRTYALAILLTGRFIIDG